MNTYRNKLEKYLHEIPAAETPPVAYVFGMIDFADWLDKHEPTSTESPADRVLEPDEIMQEGDIVCGSGFSSFVVNNSAGEKAQRYLVDWLPSATVYVIRPAKRG